MQHEDFDLDKMREIVSDINGVTRLSENHFLVKSQHGHRMSYNVKQVSDTDIWTCQCDDFYYRLTRKDDKNCKHIASCIVLKDIPQEKKKIEKIDHPKICPRCNCTTIRKNGFRIIKNKDTKRQRYSCKQCKYQFIKNENSLVMTRSDPKIISESLNLVMSGMSYRNAARHIQISHGIGISHVSILNWIKKYTGIIKEYVESFYPDLGDVLCLDEMVLNVKNTQQMKRKGFYNWLWSTIDPKTRFLVATEISKKREIDDAQKILSSSKNRITKNPNYIITDSLSSYDDAICKEFKNRVAHIKTQSIREGFVNRPIERYHNEIRERLKSRRGLGNDESSKIFAELLKINHNFVKPHMGLDGLTPAQAAGIELNLGDDKYLDLIKQATKKKEYDLIPQLGKRANLVQIIDENDSIRIIQKQWIEKKTWREINDILRLNGFSWLSNGTDSCWLKEL
jgi:transposase-like protein